MNDSKNMVIDRIFEFKESNRISDELFNDLISDNEGILQEKYPDFFPPSAF